MPNQPFSNASFVPGRRIACLPILSGAVASFLMAVAMRAEAGSEMLYPPRRAPLQSSVTVTRAPAPPSVPKVKFTSRPHLLAVGPTTIDVKPVAGPRLRNPPLLPPPPKVATLEPEEAPKVPEPAPAPPGEPSVLSPDAPPVRLPSEKPEPTPAPEKKTEQKDGLLTPSDRAEQELRDAVMYFETPVGPHGARVTVPVPMPNGTAPAAPWTESRATYTTEKKDK